MSVAPALPGFACPTVHQPAIEPHHAVAGVAEHHLDGDLGVAVGQEVDGERVSEDAGRYRLLDPGG